MLVYFKAKVINREWDKQKEVYGMSYGDTLADAAKRILSDGLDEREVISLTLYPESEVVDNNDYPEFKCIVNKLDAALNLDFE